MNEQEQTGADIGQEQEQEQEQAAPTMADAARLLAVLAESRMIGTGRKRSPRADYDAADVFADAAIELAQIAPAIIAEIVAAGIAGQTPESDRRNDMTNERAQALAAARNALVFLAMNQTEPITVEKIGGDAHVTLDRVVLRYQDYDDWSEIDYREFDSDTWRSVGDVDEMTDELQDEIHDAMTTIDAYAYHYGVDELNEAAADVAVAE